MFAVVTVITELIVTVFGKTDQLVRKNLIFMYTSNNCSDTVDANRNVCGMKKSL